MRKREVLELLNRALIDAQMERAAFSQIHSKGPFPTNEAEVDKFIKDRTRIYRESWIVSPLKRAISLIEQDGEEGTTTVMTHELYDIEKRALLDTVLDRARADLNDGRPLTEMRQPRSEMAEEQRELFIDASTLAYTAIRFSGLWKQLSGSEWDEMADKFGAMLVNNLNEWVDAEMARRETESEEMDTWLTSKS